MNFYFMTLQMNSGIVSKASKIILIVLMDEIHRALKLCKQVFPSPFAFPSLGVLIKKVLRYNKLASTANVFAIGSQ